MESWQKCFPQHCGSDMLCCDPDRSYLWDTWTQLQATSQLSAHTETSVRCGMNPSLTSNSLKLPLHGQREGTAETAKPQGNADHRFSFDHMVWAVTGENARAEVEQ